MKIRSIQLLLFVSFSVNMHSHSLVQMDTFPGLKIIERERIDTVSIFDYDTGEERITVVKGVGDFIRVVDTLNGWNPKTKERAKIIDKKEISIQEYYELYGAERCKVAENYLKELAFEISKDESRKIDTLKSFNYNRFSETIKVMKTVSPCYIFKWGYYYFDGLGTMSMSTFRELVDSELNFKMHVLDSEKCEDVQDFSFRMVFLPVGQLPDVFKISSKRKRLPILKSIDYPLMSGGRILIEDIKVNGERVLDAIVLRLD